MVCTCDKRVSGKIWGKCVCNYKFPSSGENYNPVSLSEYNFDFLCSKGSAFWRFEVFKTNILVEDYIVLYSIVELQLKSKGKKSPLSHYFH